MRENFGYITRGGDHLIWFADQLRRIPSWERLPTEFVPGDVIRLFVPGYSPEVDGPDAHFAAIGVVESANGVSGIRWTQPYRDEWVRSLRNDPEIQKRFGHLWKHAPLTSDPAANRVNTGNES